MEWKPISTAPKDGTEIDIWAKHWRCNADDFIFRRFPSCRWRERFENRAGYWSGLDTGWHATNWCELPAPPKESE